ncbi:MAG TPA: SBBP repeat-containing protein, partial [Anaerolineaceae bacterium]|nr:SBBP repeat-containing protein [Anaerolineaceae bacterium]
MSAINTNQQTNSTLKPRSSKAFILLTLLLCLVWITSLILVPKSKPTSAHSNLARLPLAFIPNYGQSASEGLFQVHDQYGSIFLTQSEMVLLSNQAGPVRIAYQGTQPTVSVQGRQGLPGKVNYIMGRNRLKGLPTYAEVDYQGLYPGVDLRYTGQNGVLESFYDLDAGVDPAIIRWKHSGAELARVDSSGSLLLYQAVSDPEPVLVEKAPSAWQEINGSRVTIPARYIANLDGSYGFSLEAYNPAYAITIDPTLVYGSYFGGSKMEQAGGIALDGQGNIYIAGDTFSTDFPQDGGVQTTSKGGDDAYILKLDPTGQTLLYATYLGGSGDDSATAISVDSAGKAAVVGDTDSTDFPTYHAYASAYKAFDDAFVVVLGPDGSQLLYGTYLGGSTWADSAEGVVLDESGAVYVTGTTYSSDFPLKHAVQSTLGGVQDAFVAKLDPTLNGADSLVYSTFLGGSAVEYGSAIALGAGGEAVVSGQTFSTDFPTKKPVQAALKGSGDAFIARLNAAGDGLVYSTYLGGSKEDKAYSVALSSKGIAYVTGTTASTDFPTLSAFQNANAGGDDAFITALKADGSAWLLSSYWGGASADSGYDLTLGPNDSLYVTGQTNSADFPTKNSLQAYMGDGDAFVTKFSAGNTTVDYSTYLGGGGAEYSGGIVTDGLSAAYITGATLSTNFPTKDPLYASAAGGGDVFIAKIDDKGD